MKKPLLLLLCGILLSGCGTQGGDSNTVTFGVADSEYQLTLPTEWSRLQVPPQSDAIILARKGASNFALLIRPQVEPNLSANIYASATQDFAYFEGQEFADKQWAFRAKVQSTDPLRTYYQRIEFPENADFFLMASCSYEEHVDDSADCLALLNSWEPYTDTDEPDENTPDENDGLLDPEFRETELGDFTRRYEEAKKKLGLE